MKTLFRGALRWVRNTLVALGAVAVGTAAFANYFASPPGSGTTFASLVISSAHYAAMVLCDATVGQTQCAAVNAIGQVNVTLPAGADVTEGSTIDPKCTSGSAPCTVNARLASIEDSVNGFGTLANGAPLVSGTTAAMTGTTSTQVIALVASQRLYITRIKCNNSSATATLVQIRDGSAGSVLDTLAAGATYGGEQGTGSTPLFWTTAGNALFAQDVTTGASVICTASGYSG